LKSNCFNLKVKKNFKDYLSCDIIEEKELNQKIILQPHLRNKLRGKFGNEVIEKRTYRNPETLRFKLISIDQDLELIDPELQSRYCSGVGILLYLKKYARPDICNIVRELCECMDNETMRTYLGMLRVIKFSWTQTTFASKFDQNLKIGTGI
jgi:hypothetical protein